MDLSEAISFVADLGAKAATQEANVKIIPIEQDPERYIVQHGDKHEFVAVPKFVVARRKHTVTSIDSLVELACAAPDPTIWHDCGAIVLVWNDAERDERVTMAIHQTKAFAKAIDSVNKRLEQKEFLRLVRVDLRSALVEYDKILPAVRTLKFENNQSGYSHIQHGGESLGREVLANVTGADQIPEDCNLKLNVYREFASGATIPCALDIDVEARKLSLSPIGDSLENAVAAAQDALHAILVEAVEKAALEAPVYYGTP